MNNDNNFETEYDSLKDVTEFQKNMYNPGHYVGTGRVSPTVSAPGNATPLAVMCFCASAFFLVFGLLLFFSDVEVTSSGIIESATANKAIFLIIMVIIAVVLSVFGFLYLKKAKKYYKAKKKIEAEPIDDSTEDELWQRTCPKCGESHDIDYPKCPNCKHNYLE